jgi:hypothetical protein
MENNGQAVELTRFCWSNPPYSLINKYEE